jgi:AcrR family transcriptional regulator
MSELSPAGRRLLDVAADVFYAEGIRATGVDTLTERAGVSKPTLYSQFGSKENLVAAVLDQRRARRQQALATYLGQADETGTARLLSVFDWLASGHSRDGFRGCPFTNAAVELPDPGHPARAVISRYKNWLKDTLTGLADDAGLDQPGDLADALLLLIDGANARVVTVGDTTAIHRAKAAAARLIGAARQVNGRPASRPGKENSCDQLSGRD